jgi:hypothetical protein
MEHFNSYSLFAVRMWSGSTQSTCAGVIDVEFSSSLTSIHPKIEVNPTTSKKRPTIFGEKISFLNMTLTCSQKIE